MRKVHVIDSHTGGEPTRVVIAGGPDLGGGTMAQRLERFRTAHDTFRSAVVNEPRGNDAMVGALLCEPDGVIFFNNVGYLGMCGHGTIGLVATLAYLGRVQPGVHRFDTPVGPITAQLHSNGEVTVNNVASYRAHKGFEIEAAGYGRVRGDIAWGGNWFYLVERSPIELDLRNLEALTNYAWAIRQELGRRGHAEIDHIELFAPSATADSRNFVLCPGKAYDRSPCGTGTSAKLACLAADGKLKPGEPWRQESIVGSCFEGSYTLRGTEVLPHIRGSAHVNAEAHLLLDDADPFCWGIRGG